MEFIDIIYSSDNTKITIPETLCSNFKEVKQWAEDFNNGLNPDAIIAEYKHKLYLNVRDIKSAIYECQDVTPIWN